MIFRLLFEGPNGVLQGSYVELVQRCARRQVLIAVSGSCHFERATAGPADGLAMGHFPPGPGTRSEWSGCIFSVLLQYIDMDSPVRQGFPVDSPSAQEFIWEDGGGRRAIQYRENVERSARR